jgi:hypothetical protein
MATVAGAFETREMARRADDGLTAAGVRADQLSVPGPGGEPTDLTPEGEAAAKVATGAGIGAEAVLANAEAEGPIRRSPGDA